MYKDSIFNTTIVCIDQYENKNPCGRIYNSAYNCGITFQSTIDLLLNMEAILEETQTPQAYSSKRVFGPVGERPAMETTSEELKEGKLATFSLRILFRQNASWQGLLHWHEGRQEESFRSVLELLLLIDSAMTPQVQ